MKSSALKSHKLQASYTSNAAQSKNLGIRTANPSMRNLQEHISPANYNSTTSLHKNSLLSNANPQHLSINTGQISNESKQIQNLHKLGSQGQTVFTDYMSYLQNQDLPNQGKGPLTNNCALEPPNNAPAHKGKEQQLPQRVNTQTPRTQNMANHTFQAFNLTSQGGTTQSTKNANAKKVSYFGTKSPTFKAHNPIIKSSKAPLSSLSTLPSVHHRHVDLVSAKQPYASVSKRSINDTSQVANTEGPSIRNQSHMPQGFKTTLSHYNTNPSQQPQNDYQNEIESAQAFSQSQHNNQEIQITNNLVTQSANAIGQTFFSVKDSHYVDDQKHQQEDAQKSAVKAQRSNENQHRTPVGKSCSQLKNYSRQNKSRHFNQTSIYNPTMMSPTTIDLTSSSSKNKTNKLNKMLKTLINDSHPSYNQLAQSQTSRAPLQPHNKPSLQQSTQKNASKNKTAIQNFKKQVATKREKSQGQSTLNTKVNKPSTSLSHYGNKYASAKYNIVQETAEKIKNSRTEDASDATKMKPFEPFSSKTEKSSIIIQMENMKKEIDELKKTKQAADSKDKKIITLEKKLRTISQERNKLKHQLSASRAGGVGGQIDTSSSGYELVNSASKNVETGGSSSSRQFAKPFQQLVSHIKSRAQKIRIEDQTMTKTTNAAGLAQRSPIINEQQIKSIAGNPTSRQFNKTRSESPLLKFKKIIPQQSFDRESNYSSQRRKENTRYRSFEGLDNDESDYLQVLDKTATVIDPRLQDNMSGLKDKVLGFVKQYQAYIKVLQNKIKKLESERQQQQSREAKNKVC